MKRFITVLALLLALTGCKKDKDETTVTTKTSDTLAETKKLTFAHNEVFEKKSALGKKEPRTYVTINVPEAMGSGAASDSINNGIFHAVRAIVHFGDTPATAKSYSEITDTFIAEYEALVKKYPDEDVPWEAKVDGKIAYDNDTIINIKLTSYTFVGGAHGYGSDMSLLFDAKTGYTIKQDALFKDKKGFTALAEKKFRDKYKIKGNINSTGLFFLNEKFALPNNIFLSDKGYVLQYNTDEVAAHAEGQKDVLITYEEAKPFLK